MLASVKLNNISVICFYLVQITVHIVEMVSGINNLLKDTAQFLEEKASELRAEPQLLSSGPHSVKRSKHHLMEVKVKHKRENYLVHLT